MTMTMMKPLKMSVHDYETFDFSVLHLSQDSDSDGSAPPRRKAGKGGKGKGGATANPEDCKQQ